ncbi:MAG: polyamine aminopropyltransferase [Chloroflexi bacterium]|nr:polyamine aminopropyltransferase [Chloroflexota bacterium]
MASTKNVASNQWKAFSLRTGQRIDYEVRRTLLAKKTPYQKLEFFDTVSYGLAMFLDDKIQSSAADEFIYHEALVHPAMLAHPAPRAVFIAGGGEGATLREALRHNTVQKAVMVDIDEEAVRACMEHLKAWHQGAFTDRRTTLVYADARAYLEKTEQVFDSIIVDVTDPLVGGPSYLLFTREFYQLAFRRLAPNGTIAVQAESADLTVIEGHLAIARTLGDVFPRVRAYQAHVPSFGESWGFVVGSKGQDPADLTADEVDQRLEARGCSGLRFYDGITHRALFSPPRYVRQAQAQPGRVITDDNPYFVIV